MTNSSNGDRLNQIESAIERIIEIQRNQIDINAAFQTQLSQLAERQAQTDEQVRTTSAGLEQLHQIVMRRERGENGGQQP